MAIPTPSADRTAIVTGASSGIAREIARLLAERGHGVTLVARREERLRDLAGELHDAHGTRAEPVVADRIAAVDARLAPRRVLVPLVARRHPGLDR